jgi:hypothetical protein
MLRKRDSLDPASVAWLPSHRLSAIGLRQNRAMGQSRDMHCFLFNVRTQAGTQVGANRQINACGEQHFQVQFQPHCRRAAPISF